MWRSSTTRISRPGGEKSLGTAVLGNAKLAAQTGAAVSALLGGAVVTLSYGHLLWANAILSWIPMLLVLGVTEPPRPWTKGRNGPEAQGGTLRHAAYGTPRRGSSSSTWSAGGPPGS